jgi:L,D-transpeptidase ErfK/SrfK
MKTVWVLGACLYTLSTPAYAGPPIAPAPALMPIAGALGKALVRDDETLLDIAFDRRLGYEAVVRLNSGVDPWIPVPGTVVQLPTVYVLPNVEQRGLVINVPEMRLYDFSVDPPAVLAAAIGDMADPSILGDFRIGTKRENPAWNVPTSPLGSRWMTIGRTSYGIHGTNVRWSIGRMATHGCIRLYEDEVQQLFDRTQEGTPIRLVYQPFKWGIERGVLFVEVHPDVYALHPDRLAEALRTPRALGLLPAIDLERLWRAVEDMRGIPVPVGRLPEPPPLEAISTPTS